MCSLVYMRGSRIFSGVSRSDGQKQFGKLFLVLIFFYSLQRGSNGFITE